MLRTVRPEAPQSAALEMLRDVKRRVRLAVLDYKSNSHLRYLRECSPDGLINSLNVDRFRAELAAMEVERMTLLPPIAPPAVRRLNRIPRRRHDMGPALGLALAFAPGIAFAAYLFS